MGLGSVVQVGWVGLVGDEGGVDGVVRGGGGRSRKRRTRRRFSSPAAEERSQQRGGGGRGGARVAWTRRTLAAGRRSPGQLRWTANDGALRGGAETVREHYHVKHTRQTKTNKSSWSEEKLILDYMALISSRVDLHHLFHQHGNCAETISAFPPQKS